jgi:hypothetical protein
MSNKLITFIFTLCLLLGLLLVAIVLADEVANAGGIVHSEITGMAVGGDGKLRLEGIGTYAFLFQSLLLLLIVCLCALGVSPRYRSTTFYGYMALCYGLMLFIWWQMYFGHQQFMQTDEVTYFMGFPTPTAWQMYGTWLGAIPLMLIYTLGFRKFIYTQADDQAFQALLSEHKSTTHR